MNCIDPLDFRIWKLPTNLMDSLTMENIITAKTLSDMPSVQSTWVNFLKIHHIYFIQTVFLEIMLFMRTESYPDKEIAGRYHPCRLM